MSLETLTTEQKKQLNLKLDHELKKVMGVIHKANVRLQKLYKYRQRLYREKSILNCPGHEFSEIEAGGGEVLLWCTECEYIKSREQSDETE